MSPEELRAKVAVMRELGVQTCDGIHLGPEPTKLSYLQRRAAKGEAVDPAEMEREVRAEARQSVRDRIGADLSDADCDRYLPLEIRELAT